LSFMSAREMPVMFAYGGGGLAILGAFKYYDIFSVYQ